MNCIDDIKDIYGNKIILGREYNISDIVNIDQIKNLGYIIQYVPAFQRDGNICVVIKKNKIYEPYFFLYCFSNSVTLSNFSAIILS